MADDIISNPRFEALRNALYHTERRTFLDLLNRILIFLVILSGAAVAGKAARLIPIEESWLELSVVVFAALQLVFDFGRRARVHEYLQRRYHDLLAEMAAEDLDDPQTAKRWSAKLLAVAVDEPVRMRALEAIAHNKALAADSPDAEPMRARRLWVGWWQRRLRHLFAFHSAAFPSERDHEIERFGRWHRRAARRVAPSSRIALPARAASIETHDPGIPQEEADHQSRANSPRRNEKLDAA